MITTTVSTKGLNTLQTFAAQAANQLPFATSLALNQTARDAQLALKAQTSIAFNQPTAFTRSAFRYSKSTKTSLVAEVFNSPDRPFIGTQTFGGRRRWKDYEGFIRGLAASSGQPLPPGKLLPTSLAQNAAGNPKRSLFAQIQSNLSTTDRGGFFIGTPRGGSTPGVYRRSRLRLFPYFIVADNEPTYQPRFPFERTANASIARTFPTHLSKAIDRALASARR
jgi:hypothetical protein